MSNRVWRWGWIVPVLALGALGIPRVAHAAPAGDEAKPAATAEASIADVLSGTAVPLTVKLKDLTPDWRRVQVAGDAMLGMGGMMQSMVEGLGSMFGGGGASEALYTRGAVLKIGDQQFLVAYRLRSQGLNFGALMAMGAAGAGGPGIPGGAPPGGPPPMPEPQPVTPDSELTLMLVNVRSIASVSDIRPFNMEEAMRAAAEPAGLLGLFQQAALAAQASGEENLQEMAAAVMSYVETHDGSLPPMKNVEVLRQALAPYVEDPTVFESPATNQPFLPNPNLSGRKLRTLLNPGSYVLLYSAAPEPDGTRLVARADGTVRSVAPAEWEKLVQAQKLPGP